MTYENIIEYCTNEIYSDVADSYLYPDRDQDGILDNFYTFISRGVEKAVEMARKRKDEFKGRKKRKTK